MFATVRFEPPQELTAEVLEQQDSQTIVRPSDNTRVDLQTPVFGSQERSENSAKRALVDVINTKVKITFGKRIYKSIKEARIKAALQSRFVTLSDLVREQSLVRYILIATSTVFKGAATARSVCLLHGRYLSWPRRSHGIRLTPTSDRALIHFLERRDDCGNHRLQRLEQLHAHPASQTERSLRRFNVTRFDTTLVVPFIPASLGMLVGFVLRGFQTRRFSIRGEFEYRYDDLCLVHSNSDSPLSLHRLYSTSSHAKAVDIRRSASIIPLVDYNEVPHLPSDAAAFPSQGLDETDATMRCCSAGLTQSPESVVASALLESTLAMVLFSMFRLSNSACYEQFTPQQTLAPILPSPYARTHHGCHPCRRPGCSLLDEYQGCSASQDGHQSPEAEYPVMLESARSKLKSPRWTQKIKTFTSILNSDDIVLEVRVGGFCLLHSTVSPIPTPNCKTGVGDRWVIVNPPHWHRCWDRKD
ncbi:hypothetical protein M436DRAFT_67769 [Aureobasidium namibiae CBS 147.97]|uniref:Uncharacterized protein n=1 Tax=Aureobasidium namibiae CBS 147.97 TaxID=1043004 RepID=A0A074WG51_9PEZI|nr:uncharacterized protein M436DRAFT_67769 [Aureobasidium namibiae CBS 147.97]KEQ68852.1 hypothetical protein M436DRAFT_67769 [Aureobasidium namibiae CBS 147.97]